MGGLVLGGGVGVGLDGIGATEIGGGVAVGVADFGDKPSRVAADCPGVWLINVGPGEIGEEISRDLRPARGDQGQGRGVAEDRRRADLAELHGLGVNLLQSLVMYLLGSPDRCRPIGQGAVARRVDRARVGLVRIELRGTL